MKRIIVLLLCSLLGCVSQTSAEQLGLAIYGAENYVTDSTGKAVSAYDGYIVTYWWGDSASSQLQIGAAASFFADADYGPEAAGLFEGAIMYVDSAREAPIYIEARIFQYSPSMTIDEAYVSSLNSSGNFAPFETFWNLIQGTDVSQGVISFSGFLDVQGRSTPVQLNPAVYQLSGIPGTLPGQVPEPATWAVLAGLAVLAFVAARRVRK